MSETFQILAIDGGGIKGLFSAAVLAHLEEDLKTSISSHFDLIVGTSTGGIIALGLGLGLSPRQIVDFYVDEGPRIFATGFLARTLRTVQRGVRRKFNSDGLREALQSVFGDATLADSKKRLVIPAYNLGDDDIYLFKTPHHERLKRDFRVPMWKVAMATSAAPTYFSAFREIDSVRLIDGGVWANNPSLIGILEATSMLGVSPQDIRLLSLGTLDDVACCPKRLDWGGLLQWASRASDVILRAQSKGVVAQAMHFLNQERAVRLNPKVPLGLFRLDRLSTKEHMGKAAHESRHFAPTFEKMFLSHRAPEFRPVLPVMGLEQRGTAKSE